MGMKPQKPATAGTEEVAQAKPVRDFVDEAGVESFPASDPPPWTGGEGEECRKAERVRKPKEQSGDIPPDRNLT